MRCVAAPRPRPRRGGRAASAARARGARRRRRPARSQQGSEGGGGGKEEELPLYYNQPYYSDPGFSASNRPWPEVHQRLLDSGVRAVDAAEAHALGGAKEALLLDVREEEAYDEGHAAGAANVPLYIRSDDTGSLRDRVFVALLAIGGPPTEVNPDFAAQAATLLDTAGAPLAVLCETGGALGGGSWVSMGQRVPKTGERSRSLEAIFLLLEAGVPPSRLVHVKGGQRAWRWADLPETMTVLADDSDSDDGW